MYQKGNMSTGALPQRLKQFTATKLNNEGIEV